MFYTQLEAAQKGFVTDAMKIVAEKGTHGCRAIASASCFRTSCYSL